MSCVKGAWEKREREVLKDLYLGVRRSRVERSWASELDRPEWGILALLWDLGQALNLAEPQFPQQVVGRNGE